MREKNTKTQENRAEEPADESARTSSREPTQPSNQHPFLRYTVLRLAIFFFVLLLLWLVQVRGLLLVALAILISGLASFTLLSKQRDEMSIKVAEARGRRKERAATRAAREDGIADELAEEYDRTDAIDSTQAANAAHATALPQESERARPR